MGSAPALLDGFAAETGLADKAYDSNAFRQIVAQTGAEAVIPSNRSLKVLIPHDPIVYKRSNRIERRLNKLKYFRRFATRYDCRNLQLLAFIHHSSRSSNDLDATTVDST